MPRVKLLSRKEDVAPKDHALYEELSQLRGRLSGPATVVFHSPALSKPWNDQSEFLHKESIVEPGYAELAVSAAARERNCRYIWSAHSRAARRAGIGEATLAAARDNAGLEGLPPLEAAIISYTRQLLRNNRVDDETFDQLFKAKGAQWLVELTGFIGRYAALAGILNAFEVEAKDDAEPLPVPMPDAPTAHTAARPPHSTPRVAPITGRDQLPEDQRPYYDKVANQRGSVRGPYGIVMHSPKFCTLVSAVSRYLRFDSLLAQNVVELCTIAVAREKDCPYVWAAHVGAARKAGVSEPAVAAIRDRVAVAGLEGDEADVVSYVRELHQTHRVDQALFDRLRERHGVPWLVELTALIGHYGMVISQLNAFEVAPAATAEQLPL